MITDEDTPEDGNEEDGGFDGYPTKEFFINMLTKDIDLIPAIIDLVDNSVDGARRTRESDESNFEAFQVSLELDPDQFRIKDNCGGIPLDRARQYAFRFGRPKDADFESGSIGQFGVGMKRALFKLGTEFRITSTSNEARFQIEVDVENWSDPDQNWNFEPDELEERGFDSEETGTEILVRELRDEVSSYFGQERFRNRLRDELKSRHMRTMQKGFSIRLDGQPLEPRWPELLQSEEISCAFKKEDIVRGDSEIEKTFYVGLGDSTEAEDAGWYLFCNDREILGADKSEQTGWGYDGRIPRFHSEYNHFRGFLFLETEDGEALPWNTTKTGVEAGSRFFHGLREEMIQLMDPVISFLRAVAKEDEEESPGADAIEDAELAELPDLDIDGNQEFRAPNPNVERRPDKAHIRYSKPLQKFEEVKEELGVQTKKEVGEKTFDFYYRLTCD